MWDDEQALRKQSPLWWVVGAVVAVAVIVGGWFWYRARAGAQPNPQAMHANAPVPAVNSAPQIEHPLPAADNSAALPALNDSDQVVTDSLIGVLGKAPVAQYLVPQNIVRHIVVTVDNLPRHKVAADLRPIKPTPGQTLTASQGAVTTLSNTNFERYAGVVRVIGASDAKSLAVVYERLYPLFQQAYEDLGYPGKYFNDRLVETIDDMLQAPEVAAPIALVQPKVFWEYADAGLENRSAGQKLLIRMGPANARIIKAKLREFRAEIVKNNH
jgi:Protein of unknown function (DUF3014)